MLPQAGSGFTSAAVIASKMRACGIEFEDNELYELVHGVIGDVVGESVGPDTAINFPQFLALMAKHGSGLAASEELDNVFAYFDVGLR